MTQVVFILLPYYCPAPFNQYTVNKMDLGHGFPSLCFECGYRKHHYIIKRGLAKRL